MNNEIVYPSPKDVTNDNKHKYGEVVTPQYIVDMMCDLLPSELYDDMSKQWLDFGCGSGQYIYGILSRTARENRRYMIENNIYGVDINKKRVQECQNMLGNITKNVENVICGDFLSYAEDCLRENKLFDVIIGNPPYNSQGIKKTPTNTTKDKRIDDGKTLWCSFIRKSISLLRENGYLLCIVPSIWMKPDRAGIYKLLSQDNTIISLRCFDNTETNRIFGGHAQTPTSIILLQKRKQKDINERNIDLWDNITNTYIPYTIYNNDPIPVTNISLINELYKLTRTVGSINVHKTMLPSKHISLVTQPDDERKYKNIRSCIIDKCDNSTKLTYEYSNKPCSIHYGYEKLVLAHKMYGFPYYDMSGELGISNRDNYVLSSRVYSREKLTKLGCFLSSRMVRLCFESTRYRMKYLEKYIFELLPDISTIDDFPVVNYGCSQKQFLDYERKVYDCLKIPQNIVDFIEENTSKKEYHSFWVQ